MDINKSWQAYLLETESCFRTILENVVEHNNRVIHLFINFLPVLSFVRKGFMIKINFPVHGHFLLRFDFPKLLCSVQNYKKYLYKWASRRRKMDKFSCSLWPGRRSTFGFLPKLLQSINYTQSRQWICSKWTFFRRTGYVFGWLISDIHLFCRKFVET